MSQQDAPSGCAPVRLISASVHRSRSRRGRSRRAAALVGTVAVSLLALGSTCAPPAFASGTFEALPPGNVEILSATLRAHGEGWLEGKNYTETEYCEFLYRGLNPVTGSFESEWQQSSPQWGSVQPCNGNKENGHLLEAHVGALQPGWQYFYTVARCYEVAQESGYLVCKGPHAYTDGIAQAWPCKPYQSAAPVSCPSFTTNEPRAKAQSATHVLGTSATLNGKLQIEDLAGSGSEYVEYYFEYSTDSSFASALRTEVQRLPQNDPEREPAVSQTVEGLTPGTTYYFRPVVQAAELGVTTPQKGEPLSFKTGGYAVTLAATNTLETEATLNGELAAGNNAVEYFWLVSTSPVTGANGLLASNPFRVGGGTLNAGEVKMVSAVAGGLKPTTTYYAQLVTSEGALHGGVIPFSTSAPCAHEQYQDVLIPSTGFVVSGCFAKSGSSAHPTYTGYGTIDLNGLQFAGTSSSSIAINTEKETVTTTAGHIQLGTLILTLGATWNYTNATSGGETVSKIRVEHDPGEKLYGFPILGEIAISAYSGGRSHIVAEVLGAPALLGKSTAVGEAWVSESGAIESLFVTIGHAEFGPFELPDVELHYHAATGEWVGTASLNFPFAKFGGSVSIEVKNGELNGLGGSFSSPGLALPGGLVLSSFAFNTVFNPLQLEGNLGFGWGPDVGNAKLFGGTLGFYMGFDANQTIANVPGIESGTELREVPLTLKLRGTFNLFGFINLARAELAYYDLAQPFITAYASLSEPLLVRCRTSGEAGVIPSLLVRGDSYGTEFNLIGEGSVKVKLCGGPINIAEAFLTISNKGADACGIVGKMAMGVGFHWSSLPKSLGEFTSDFSLYEPGATSNCNVSEYIQELGLPKEDFASTASAGAATAASAGARPLRLPGGLRFEVIRVKGAGAPPLVKVTGPGGLLAQSATDGEPVIAPGRYLIIPDGFNDTTYIELARPQAGAYHLSLLPGSAKVVSLGAAHALPPVTLHARLRRHGRRLLLSWRANDKAGLAIDFAELGGAGGHLLLRTTAAQGRRVIRPRPGLAGKRTLLAYLYAHGTLARVIRVAAFTGPRLPLPTPPRRLRATRSGTTVSLRWQPSARAVRYRVTLLLPNHTVRVIFTKSHRVTVHGVPATGALKATVSGIDALARTGHSATVAVGKPAKRPARHHPKHKRKRRRRRR